MFFFFKSKKKDNRIDRFEIINRIGRGGFASVYSAKAYPSGEIIAVKVPNTAINQNREFLRRFEREVKISMKLDHPNIVKVFKVGKMPEGTPYMAMEYLSGGTLKEAIKRNTLDIENSKNIILTIANTLIYAHAKNVIHRDIKPENIKRNSKNVYKIMDFGIARELNDIGLTATGVIVGTPYYMAPEQALKSSKPDVRSDIYSLGAMFYEMLTRKVPFEGNPYEVIKKHINAYPIPPRSINHAIPLYLNNIILRCLQKNPQNRYQSADELISEIDSHSPHPTTLPEKQESKRKKSRNAILTIIQGPFAVGKTVNLDCKEAYTLGRSKNTDICIPWDASLTNIHAKIYYKNSQYVIEDLNSQNGVYVNNVRIKNIYLKPNDRIKIGRTIFQFN